MVNDCITFVLSKRGIRRILPLPSSTTIKVALVIFMLTWSRPTTFCFVSIFSREMLLDVPVQALLTAEPVVLVVK